MAENSDICWGTCHARPLVGPGQDGRSMHDRAMANDGACPFCDCTRIFEREGD